MKLIVNARFLGQQQSGVQHFAKGVVSALLEKGVALELVAPSGTGASADMNVTACGPSNGFLWEQFFLPKYVKKQGAILLSLCNSAPVRLRNQAVTVHDLAFEQNKNWFSPAFRSWYRFMIPRICRRAHMIFTVSEFSKQEIIRHYRIAETKIHVIPNGLPELPVANGKSLHNSYFVMTSVNNPRKNAAEIFQYIDLVAAKNYKLIALKSDAAVFGNTDLPKHPAITYLNHIPGAEYYNLLRNAKALIYPSLYEGFGIPVLESLCLQTPVIAADLDVYRESFGTLPVYFRHRDRSSFQEALEMIEKTEISGEAIKQLKEKYSFQRAAELLLQQLETIGNK